MLWRKQPKPTSPTSPDKIDEKNKRAQRWKLIIALVLPNFLAAADTTIVSPAIELISLHFNQLQGSFSWLVTAYTLTNATFTPISGQIADNYGRHAALQFHIFWMLVGSVLCAAAQTWPMLLLGRALQGVGSSGIQNLTHIILSDGVSLDENATNNSVFSLVNGIGFAIGPVVGGYLADLGWRYLFVLSVGVALSSHILVFLLIRNDLRSGSIEPKVWSRLKGLQTFDIFGIFLFLFGTGLLILAVSWGGTEYSWQSAAVIAPLIIGGILFLGFFGYEYLMEPDRFMARLLPKQSPLIPLSLFRKKDTWLLSVINFATGAALYSAFYFASLYWTVAEGYSSSRAGVQLLYYTPGLGAGIYLAMFMCNRWPARTFDPLFLGAIVEAVGIGMLAYAVDGRHTSLVHGFMAMAGVGTGLRFMPVVLHASGLWSQKWRASIMSLLGFWISFAGTISIAMMGSVYTNSFRDLLGSAGPEFANETSVSTRAGQGIDYSTLPTDVRQQIQNAAAKSVKWAFVSILPFLVISAIASVFLGNVWIKEKTDNGNPAKVLEGSYLRAVVQSTVETQSQAREDEGNSSRNMQTTSISEC